MAWAACLPVLNGEYAPACAPRGEGIEFRVLTPGPRLAAALLFAFVCGPFVQPLAAAPPTGERTAVRLLHGFETAADFEATQKFAENCELLPVLDNGVTEGKRCARLTVPKGSPWGSFTLGAAALKNWSDFDYFACDLYCDDEHGYEIQFELFDDLSKNYPTRCTYSSAPTHPGRQTLLFRINRAKRNGKEGRDWEELEPQDKIKLDGLTRVKLFLTPRADRNAVFWIDNLRLMQEDAAKPKLKLPLPAGAIAFDFGSPGAVVPGFRGVSPASRFVEGPDAAGFVQPPESLTAAGEGWPDLLSGTYVWSPRSEPLEFRARVPAGKYHAWLAAGPVIRPDLAARKFVLQLNDKTFHDAEPTWAEFASEKFLYRFLRTGYSKRPDALWTDYVRRMYPAETAVVTIADGLLKLTAQNHFLGGLVLVPVAEAERFGPFVAEVDNARRAAFEKTYFRPARPEPMRAAADGEYALFVPNEATTILPWTGPTAEERNRQRLAAAAAPGQRVALRLAVTPFADLGRSSLMLPELVGPGGEKISAAQIRGYHVAYRSDGKDVSERCLLPWTTLPMEAGVTQSFWLWLHVPPQAKPGVYRGQATFRPEHGSPREVPLELEVYPFQLVADLPASFGMYYQPRRLPDFTPEFRRRGHLEQFQFMREIGFTAVTVGSPAVAGLGPNGQVRLQFDSFFHDLAREAGFGRRPEQLQMAQALGVGRGIARRLPGTPGPTVDRQPGIELTQPEFRGYFLNAMRQYAEFLQKTGLPVAVEGVDEPRETPNPWNRNLADTIAYGSMLKQVPGLTSFVTPMGDRNAGKDYTVLADHFDVISVHGWEASRGLIARTKQQGKRLWLYNTGMDRFSWGFYNWRAGSTGRWEWHFSWPEETAVGGYPGLEWHNPFTGLHGFAVNAPDAEYPGGLLFQSAFLRVSEGINDYAYLITLEQALAAAEAQGRSANVVREARAFLSALGRAIPEFPHVKGLASPDDGALVGLGLEDDARGRLADWRAKIAGYLKALSAK